MVLRCRLAGLYYFTRNAFALKGENMKIIIVGCGKVGTALTAQLSREDNLVTVIDTDSIVMIQNTAFLLMVKMQEKCRQILAASFLSV